MMANKEKLAEVFVSALGIPPEEVEAAEFKATRQWDSVGHVNLMNAIEESFDISLEPDDIMDFKSFKVGLEILGRYDLESR